MVLGLPGVVEYNDFLISIRKGKIVRIYVWYSHRLTHVSQIIREEGLPVVPHGVYKPYDVSGCYSTSQGGI